MTGATVVTTLDGDMIDALVQDHYGSADMLDRVLAANPHLSGFGPVLPAGLAVTLPARASDPVAAAIRLWGAA